MNVLILGATGGTGQKLVELALAKGHAVTALVRDPSKVTQKHPALTVVAGNPTQAAALEKVVSGKDAVFGSLGPRNKADPICADAASALVGAMKKAGVKRVLWVSAGGVGDSAAPMKKASFVFGRIIMPLVLAKPYANHLRAEDALKASGLDWTIVRPLQLIDANTGNAVVATEDPPKGFKISREDVARFLVEELQANRFVKKTPMLYA